MKKRKIIAKLMVLSMIISNVSGINVQATENINLSNDNIIYNDKLKSEATILRKRNEILNHEVERLEALITKIEKEKVILKDEITLMKDEIKLLKSALEFKEEEKQHYSHYS